MRVPLVVLLLAATAVAGCTSGSDDPDDRSAGGLSGTAPGIGKGADGEGTAAGALAGRVRDTVNFSLAGSQVSVLGYDLAQKTDRSGSFHIDGVPEGRHTVRVNPGDEAYLPTETSVDVVADDTAWLDVVLPRKEEVPPGYQPHLHNFWGGEDTYLMYAGPVRLSGDTDNPYPDYNQEFYRPNFGAGTTPCRYTQVFFPPADEPGRPRAVIRGTETVTVSLDWPQGTLAPEELGLWYDTGFRKPNVVPSDDRHFDPAPPGTPFVIELDTLGGEPRQHWDNGHQLFSQWRFCIDFPEMPGRSTSPSMWEGPLDVRIELGRSAPVPLDEPHPDSWSDADERTLVTEREVVSAADEWFLPRKEVDGAWNLVPPGTERMRIELQIEYDGTYAPIGETIDGDWGMRVHTADQNPYQTEFHEYRVLEQTGTCGDACFVFEFELGDGWNDPWYQTQSLWRFQYYFINPDGDPDFQRSSWASYQGANEPGIDITIYKRADFV